MTRADAFAEAFRRGLALVRFAQHDQRGPLNISLEDDGAAWSMRVDGRVFSGRHEYESSAGEGATERV